jgi:hypothetical protein
MSPMRTLTRVSAAALLFACSGSTNLETTGALADENAPPTDGRLLTQFVGHFHAATGRLTLEPASEITPAVQALREIDVVQDGKTGSGPASTIELVTISVGIVDDDPACPGVSRTLHGQVKLNSFYPVPLRDVYMELTRVTPSDRVICNGESSAPEGLSLRFGIISYGQVEPGAANGVTRDWVFSLPSDTDFTFTGRVMAEWCGDGVCTGDETCDTCSECCTIRWAGLNEFSGVENEGARLYVSGKVWGEKVTDQPGKAEGLTAVVAVGSRGTDSAGWNEIPFDYVGDEGNDDVFGGWIAVPAAGEYEVRLRASYRGATVESEARPLKVYAPPAGGFGDIGFCNIQWPESLTLPPGGSDLVFGQVWVDGLTHHPGQAGGIVAELGFGPGASDPRSASGWRFIAGQFNGDRGNNDEYMVTLTAPQTTGTYSYVWRVRRDAGWTWCGWGGNGPGNLFDITQLGKLTVQ